jgi:exodeoxyribonuclease V alpha subunit
MRAVVHLVAGHLLRSQGYDPIRDIQMLCPMNVRSVGARSLNIELQKVINPPGAVQVERSGFTLGEGDKMMQIVNDYDKEVYNGDIGRIVSVNPDRAELVIRFDELDQVALAYATTIHKSQGSEYPVVVVPVMLQYPVMLHRNLL